MSRDGFTTFWEAAAAGQLALLTCEACGHQRLLPRPICSECGSEELIWRVASRRGTVDSVTRVHRPPAAAAAPGYQLALVRLDAGPRLLTRVEPGEVAIGDPVEIAFLPPGDDGRRLPVAHAPETFTASLERLAASHGDRIALVDGGRRGVPTTTFSELRAEVQATAAVLADAGLERGDVLLNWLPNIREWVVLTFAAASLGVLVVPLNTRFRRRELAAALSSTEPAAVAVPTGFLGIPFMETLRSVLGADTVEHARERWPSLCAVFSVDCSDDDDADLPAMTDAIDLQEAVRTVSGTASRWGRSEDPAVSFSTSGTTGKPKLAVHSQGAITTHSQNVAEAFDLSPGACLLGALPLYGVFGFSGAMAALLSGATTVLQPVFSGQEAARLIQAHGVTHCYGPDTMLGAIIEDASTAQQLATWRTGGFADFSGEGAAVARRAQEVLGVPLRGVYGSSECLALMSLWPADAPEELRLQGGGRPVSDAIEVRATDVDSGEVLAPGTEGELQVRGYNVAVGYHQDPSSTAASRTPDGWFRTGDLGFVREDGSFVYLSRLGDALRLGGYLVDPAEIEHHLTNHPMVRRAAVVGVRQQGLGDVAVAFVELEPRGDVEPETLRAHCRSHIAGFKVPARIVVLDSLPTIEGPNGVKVQRTPLRETAERIVRDPDGTGTEETDG